MKQSSPLSRLILFVSLWEWTCVSGCTPIWDGDSARDVAPAPVRAQGRDPGTGEWYKVPKFRVAGECRLDPQLLGKITANKDASWMLVRYGKICWDSSDKDTKKNNLSATKTLAAVTLGILSERVKETPKKITVESRVKDILGEDQIKPPVNKDVRIKHFLGMVAESPNLIDPKQLVFHYEGGILNEYLLEIMKFGENDLTSFVRKEVFEKLGMTSSKWNVKSSLSSGWESTKSDMARLGLLLLHDGVWGGKQLLRPGWVYDMTHPSFVTANSAYGYLTWLNVGLANWHFADSTRSSPMSLMSCAPTVVCGNNGSKRCDWDVGTWEANGIGGQLIIGHKGLDMVVVARNWGDGFDTGESLWEQIVPAIVAYDPIYCYRQDATADEKQQKIRDFCREYSKNRHAPDLAQLAPSEDCQPILESPPVFSSSDQQWRKGIRWEAANDAGVRATDAGEAQDDGHEREAR